MHFSKEEKEMWIEDWKKSGKNAWAYARMNGLVPQTFMTWTKPIKNEAKQTLVEIPKQILKAIHPEKEILIEKSDIRIHIPLEPVLGVLQTILGKLGQSL